MKMQHLGSGIALFERAVDIDTSFIKAYIDTLRAIGSESHYTNEQGTLKNMGGYEFDKSSMRSAPERFIDTLPKNDAIDDRTRQFIFNCEDALYRAAVEYCKVFPVATESVTWRIRGHIATYRSGQHIGCHSDASVPGQLGQPVQNQNSLHNTLTSAMLWTDSYEGGELSFPMWNVSIKPSAGSIVIYPSTFIGAHEVRPVTAGERVSYLQWFCHGYLSAGMPPLSKIEDPYAQYKWLPNLKQDVGQDYLYQREVI